MRAKLIFSQLPGIAMLLLPAPCQAQDRSRSASKIIEACIRAEGGPKRLAQQRAVEFQGTVTDAATKASGSFTMILERPNRLYREVTIGGESRREAYNGKSAWRQDSSGLRTLTGNEGTTLETEARFRNQRFVDYKKDKERVQSRADETVRGRAAHAVEVITATNVRRQVYFDVSSHLVLERWSHNGTTTPSRSVSFTTTIGRWTASPSPSGSNTRKALWIGW